MVEARRERKVVTVLFADLVGFTSRAEQLDPEDVAAELARYHGQLRGELERLRRDGGEVHRRCGDGRLRGAGRARGRPRARGPSRAGDPRLGRGAEGVEVRLGVNTGEALVTLGARPEAGETMVAGDVVNTAARLQSAAPVNGILVGEQTYRATRARDRLRDAEPVEAKGKAQPVRPGSVAGAGPRSRSSASTARPWSAGAARSTFSRCARPGTRGAVVPARHHRRRAGDRQEPARARALRRRSSGAPELISWRHGRCLPYGEGITFWALGEMVKAQVGILEGDDADAAGRKLAAAVSDPWVQSHLRPLVGLAGAAEGGGDMRDEAFAAWRRFFEELAEERPLVLVFEDLHWADDNLIEFVDHLVDWATAVPLLVVCTARPELLTRRPDWGGGKPNATDGARSPRSPTRTRRGSLRELLGASSGGDSGRAAGARRRQPALRRGVRPHAPRSGPDRGCCRRPSRALIAARLDLLEREQKTLLQDAAVIGKRFWAGALAALSERPSLEV